MKEIKYYPMTTSQDLLLFADKFIFKKAWMNIAAVLSIDGEVDEQIMLQAMYLALVRTPSASLRLHKADKKTIVQYFSTALPEGLELLDYSSLSDEDFLALMEKKARKAFPHKGIETQLYDLKLISRGNNRYAIYINAHHMAFDAFAVMSLIRYIADVYAVLLHGGELPRPMGSPIPMYEAEAAYAKSDAFRKELDFWKAYYDPNDEPMYTNLYGKGSKFHNKGKRTGIAVLPFKNKALHENLVIPAKTVSAVTELVAKWRITSQSFYVAALHTYLSMINDTNDVLTFNAVARRATLVQKRGGGSMVNTVAVRTKVDRAATSFRDACTAAHRSISQSYRSANVLFKDTSSIYLKNYNMGQTDGYAGVYVCYQPYFNMDNSSMKFHFQRLNNGGTTSCLYLTIMACDNSGDLVVNYEHAAAYYDAATICKFHDFLVKFLAAAVASPDETIESLAKKCL